MELTYNDYRHAKKAGLYRLAKWLKIKKASKLTRPALAVWVHSESSRLRNNETKGGFFRPGM